MITNETPVAMLNVGQLKDIISDIHQPLPKSSKQLVYGLRGICNIFNCSLSRAQELKKTIISSAVSQQGRTIVTDVEKALELFKEASKKQRNGK